MQVAIAIFAKHPDYSPVKTRLAASIGQQHANDIYIGLLNHTEDVIKSLLDSSDENIKAFWAIADETSSGETLFSGFPAFWTGPGDLGERLHQVYQRLLTDHDAVILIGSDCPDINSMCLEEAITLLKQGRYVIGPSLDGGFYLFAGSSPIPARVWLDTPYSQANTCDELCKQLALHGFCYEQLSKMRDIDTLADLEAFVKKSTEAPG